MRVLWLAVVGHGALVTEETSNPHDVRAGKAVLVVSHQQGILDTPWGSLLWGRRPEWQALRAVIGQLSRYL